MSEVCVDASLMVKLALKGEAYRAKARKFVKDCGTTGTVMIVPPLVPATENRCRLCRFDTKLHFKKELSILSF